MIIYVNGQPVDIGQYDAFHRQRFDGTMALVRELGGGRTVEVGGHPFAMTTRLLDEPMVDLFATVSAQEVSAWPDEIPVTRRSYTLTRANGTEAQFINVSANVERTLFPIFENPADDDRADLVLACEIAEHLTRAPHVMMLNVNSWLKLGGAVVVTTPNGAQFQNPFRVKPRMPAFRYSAYSRHNYLFTMTTLVDLVESCGFEVERASYWSPYGRTGGARLYRLAGALPGDYVQAKFGQALVVVARKTEDRTTARRLPSACVADGPWEFVDGIHPHSIECFDEASL
jgi:hypothetical protein